MNSTALATQFVRHPQSIWWRKAIFQIHLWTGIAMGLYVVAISVSGSALFFRSKVNEVAPGRRIVAGSGRLLTKDELIEDARRAYPDHTPGNVRQGTIAGQEVEITLNRGARRKLRIFDPYTGRDLGEAVPYSLQLMSWLLDLHVNLFAGASGRIVNGVCGQFSPLIDAAPEFVDDRSRIVLLRFCGKPFAFVENDLLLLGLYLVLSGLGDRSDELRAAAAFNGALRRLAIVEFPIAGWVLIRRVENGPLEELIVQIEPVRPRPARAASACPNNRNLRRIR
jgi:PepSY-associated TM region